MNGAGRRQERRCHAHEGRLAVLKVRLIGKPLRYVCQQCFAECASEIREAFFVNGCRAKDVI